MGPFDIAGKSGDGQLEIQSTYAHAHTHMRKFRALRLLKTTAAAAVETNRSINAGARACAPAKMSLLPPPPSFNRHFWSPENTTRTFSVRNENVARLFSFYFPFDGLFFPAAKMTMILLSNTRSPSLLPVLLHSIAKSQDSPRIKTDIRHVRRLRDNTVTGTSESRRGESRKFRK